RHVRRPAESANSLDEAANVEPLVRTDCYWPGSWNLRDHLERRLALCPASRRRYLCVDRQAVAILHQQVAREAELRRLALRPAIQPRIRIRPRLVRLVAPLLAAEIHARIAGIPRLRRLPFVLALEALLARPGLDQGAIDREM